MILASGCAVVEPGDFALAEGVRRYRVPICRALGAREIAQTVSLYNPGVAPARRNPAAEEVLYVVRGSGTCRVDGFAYPLAPGTAVYVPPASIFEIEAREPLEMVSVCCPEDDGAGLATPPVEPPTGPAPERAVCESDVGATAVGDRSFKVLADARLGCRRVTQFVGVIPPGRAPMHHHTYEEAIYILEGRGRVWTDGGNAAYGPATSIYLPRGVRHALENTGDGPVRLLGVFYPSGSPAESYPD